MNDRMDTLFRERLNGYEAPVDPGVWHLVQERIGPTPSGGDDLEQLFREHSKTYEPLVDPSAWAGISGHLGHGAAGAGGGMSASWGWLAAGAGALVLTVTAYLHQESKEGTAYIPPVATENVVQGPMMPQAQEEPPAEALPALPRKEDIGEEARKTFITTTERHKEAPIDPAPSPTPPSAHQDGEPRKASQTDTMSVPDIPQRPEGADLVERIIGQVTEAARTSLTEPEKATVPRPDPDPEPWEQEPPPPQAEAPKLFLPNTFTPNGDGVNDTYEVLNPEAFGRILTRVFEVRSNQMVFSTDNNEPWTGANCPDGYYLVAVEAITMDGQLVTQGKAVWLTRDPAR